MLLKDMTVEQLEDLIEKKFDEKLNDLFFDEEDYVIALERSKAGGWQNHTSREVREHLGF
ncbi:MAG: hypothetical protein HQK89_07105 [Nitrospirae bacterium]|nr:hypothetical protein [Nitrospirota bacterium]